MASPQLALVTGASGFIGQALCKRLRDRGVRVRGLTRRPIGGPWHETVVADIGEERTLTGVTRGVDTVFHLAAQVHGSIGTDEEERACRRVNVDGTRRILAACAAAGVRRFVFVSTVKAMGEGGGERLNEASFPAPQTAYGRSKREAERLVIAAGRQHAMHAVVIRLPLVYGAGCKGNLAVMLKAVAGHRFPPLKDLGNKRSMVHIDDVVAALLLVASQPRAAGQTYIVTDGQVYSTREIYILMCEALGRDVPTWAVPPRLLRVLAGLGDRLGSILGKRFVFDSAALDKLTSSAWYDSGKIEQELGFRACQNLKRALPNMVQALCAT
jgi:UDP-glucose 4-epimerase